MNQIKEGGARDWLLTKRVKLRSEGLVLALLTIFSTREGALRSSVQAKAKDTKKARSETGKREISEGGSQSQTNEPNGHRNSTASDLLFLP